MIKVDLQSVTKPVGIMRTTAAILTFTTFILVATVQYSKDPYWAWCMFIWFFCFFFTFLILILEFTTVNTKLPFAWDDFTIAFSMLASLMCLSASIIYPIFFTCKDCSHQISASVLSWVCFGVYTAEVVLTRLRHTGQINGFLSTLPGILKILEAFLACVIFASMQKNLFDSPGLKWCVAVYSLCFIFAILIILVTIGQLPSYFPFSFDYLMIIYNILGATMYLTAMVIWPLYSFRNCVSHCSRDKLVVVTIMTVFNTIVYIMDAVYSIYLIFFVRNQ
ncbi:myeloid-associated differentiation marker homolog [Antennarius striatus]|uniref:myeloid-associated differentiation marker homolog n=1 Tax=Antennarius striatus TaxID=241820 RepID=UPI0035AF9D19